MFQGVRGRVGPVLFRHCHNTGTREEESGG